MNKIHCLALCMVLMSCRDQVHPKAESETVEFLQGTWLLYESGYSPGAGYVVEEVPEEPPQTITFTYNGRVSSSIQGIAEYTTYEIEEDPGNGEMILVLFKKNPHSSGVHASETSRYTLKLDGASLLLYYRYCVEGCHLALRKMD